MALKDGTSHDFALLIKLSEEYKASTEHEGNGTLIII